MSPPEGGSQTIPLPPTLSIYGFKDSGKTTVMARIIEHFKAKGLQVLASKHVGDPEFTLDRPDTDSHTLAQAGAAAVILHSDASTTLLLTKPSRDLSTLLRLGIVATEADVIVLEGFRSWTQDHRQIAKIVCIRSAAEIKELTGKLKGPLLAICTLEPDLANTLHLPKQFPELLHRIDGWLTITQPLSKRE